MWGILVLGALIWALYYFFHYLGYDDKPIDKGTVKHEKIWHLFNEDNDPY